MNGLLLSTLLGALVAMLILSRLVRWPLSRFMKGAALSITADLLAIGAGSAVYTLKHEGDPTLSIIGYVVAGLVVLVVDLALDARNARLSKS